MNLCHYGCKKKSTKTNPYKQWQIIKSPPPPPPFFLATKQPTQPSLQIMTNQKWNKNKTHNYKRLKGLSSVSEWSKHRERGGEKKWHCSSWQNEWAGKQRTMGARHSIFHISRLANRIISPETLDSHSVERVASASIFSNFLDHFQEMLPPNPCYVTLEECLEKRGKQRIRVFPFVRKSWWCKEKLRNPGTETLQVQAQTQFKKLGRAGFRPQRSF